MWYRKIEFMGLKFVAVPLAWDLATMTPTRWDWKCLGKWDESEEQR